MDRELHAPKALLTTKLPRIQILRFGAALVVVLFHSLGSASKYFSGSSHLTLFRFGDLGVDMFFVISGFIIFLTVSSRERNWQLFLRRRLGRIVPMYWLMTLAMAGLLLVPGPTRSPRPTLAHLAQSLFYFAWSSGRMPVLYPGWSLEYEILFYLLVTLALAIAPRRWTGVVVAMALATAAGVAAQAAHIRNPVIDFFTDPMQLEFALGIIAAQAILRRKLAVGPLVAVIAALVLLMVGPHSDRLWRILVAGIPSVALVGLCAVADMSRPLRNADRNWLVKLGDASYSIYLTQVFVISIVAKILDRLWSNIAIDVALVTMTLATLLVSYVVHLGIERPITRWINRRPAPQKRVESLGLGSPLAASRIERLP